MVGLFSLSTGALLGYARMPTAQSHLLHLLVMGK
jgi:hypothetical protein